MPGTEFKRMSERKLANIGSRPVDRPRKCAQQGEGEPFVKGMLASYGYFSWRHFILTDQILPLAQHKCFLLLSAYRAIALTRASWAEGRSIWLPMWLGALWIACYVLSEGFGCLYKTEKHCWTSKLLIFTFQGEPLWTFLNQSANIFQAAVICKVLC